MTKRLFRDLVAQVSDCDYSSSVICPTVNFHFRFLYKTKTGISTNMTGSRNLKDPLLG